MDIVGYKTFFWSDLRKFLGLDHPAQSEVVEVRPEDYNNHQNPSTMLFDPKPTPVEPRSEGWFCIGIRADGSLDMGIQSWDRQSRGAAVEKFHKKTMALRQDLTEEQKHAFNHGWLGLNDPAIRCLDFAPVGWVKV